MKKTVTGWLFMLMAVPVQAHLYNNDFEGHTPGLSVNDEQHNSWWWWGPGANAVFAVDPQDAGNTVVDLVGGKSALHIDGYPVQNTIQEIHLNYEFDILIQDYARWDIYFTDNNTSDVIAPAFNKVGQSMVSHKVDGVETAVLVPGFVTGQWVHASIQLNQLAETWSMNLAGQQLWTDALLANTTGNGGNWAIDTERMIFETAGSVYIDNIVVSIWTDVDPPAPQMATFSSPPAAISDTEITMTATIGTDPSGPVEYFFDETSGGLGGTDSGWQTNHQYTDTGLDAETEYTYTVQMRDSVGNTGTASAPASATTEVTPNKSPDIDGDGDVDLNDASVIFNQWLFQGPGLTADLDHSQMADLIDFGMLAAAWGDILITIDSVPSKTIEDVYNGTYCVTTRPEDIITKGPWSDAAAYPSFASAVSALTTAGDAKTLLIAEEQSVAGDVTVPEYLTLAFVGGGILDIDATHTITIEGPVQSPATQIFDGAGNVLFAGYGAGAREVYPEWWGAQGNDSTDDTDAIQAAIDSLGSYGGVVSFRPGAYQNTGITLTSDVCLRGNHRGTVRLIHNAFSGACVTLANNCQRARIDNLSIRKDDSVSSGGYGVDGRDGYIENFAMENFQITNFQFGLCVEEGEDITLDTGYIACYGIGATNGTIGLKLGDYDSGYVVHRATVKDMYITVAEIDFYNNASPCTIIRPIFEVAQYAMENHSRSVLMAPFIEAIPFGGGPYNLKIEDNGMLFLGTANAQDGFEYGSSADEDKTSWIPDTFDSDTMKIGLLEMDHTGDFEQFLGKKWTQGTAAPTSGTWSRGDIRWNTSPTAGGTLFWACTAAGTPGTWKAFRIEN